MLYIRSNSCMFPRQTGSRASARVVDDFGCGARLPRIGWKDPQIPCTGRCRMPARPRLHLFSSVVIVVALGVWTLGPIARVLAEQEQVAPEVENAKVQFSGQINSNAVYVRSGPGDN